MDSAGPRAVLRVPEVLLAVATARAGRSLAQLSAELKVPKTSLHRLLHTLARGGYLSYRSGAYELGPASLHLATVITKGAPADAFPACARSTLEWLATKTHETVLLGVLSEAQTEIIYVDVLDSDASVRFTIPIGDRRPLYSAASGKAVLAFMTRAARNAYLARTKFTRFTPQTTSKSSMPAVLREIQRTGVAFERGGRVAGATGMASPIFDRDGKAFASVSVAGPADRMDANRKSIEPLVRDAGARISRVLGYAASYPESAATVVSSPTRNATVALRSRKRLSSSTT